MSIGSLNGGALTGLWGEELLEDDKFTPIGLVRLIEVAKEIS